MQSLEAEVHISLEAFEYTAAAEAIASMKTFAKNNRFGSLFEVCYSNVERFQRETWGRQKRQS